MKSTSALRTIAAATALLAPALIFAADPALARIVLNGPDEVGNALSVAGPDRTDAGGTGRGPAPAFDLGAVAVHRVVFDACPAWACGGVQELGSIKIDDKQGGTVGGTGHRRP